MVDKVKLLLNEYIYDRLNLYQIDEKLENYGIKSKEIQDSKFKTKIKYFFLLNSVYLERLSNDELQQLSNYVNANSTINKNELYDFFDKYNEKLLLPETNERYLYWGGRINDESMAPSNYIVLGFNYIKYISNDDIVNRNEEYIADVLNYIQEKLAPSKNMKIAVLKFDEVNGIGSRIL